MEGYFSFFYSLPFGFYSSVWAVRTVDEEADDRIIQQDFVCNFISAYQPCAKPVSQDALEFKGFSQNWLLRSDFSACQVIVQQLKELNLLLMIFRVWQSRS